MKKIDSEIMQMNVAFCKIFSLNLQKIFLYSLDNWRDINFLMENLEKSESFDAIF